jgi:hypothetical protein
MCAIGNCCFWGLYCNLGDKTQIVAIYIDIADCNRVLFEVLGLALGLRGQESLVHWI